jgi:hypothetical protein
MSDTPLEYETRIFEGDLVFLDPRHELRPVGRLTPEGEFMFAVVEDEDPDESSARQDDWRARIEAQYGSLDEFLEGALDVLHRLDGSPIREWRTR